jgi:hypothetical protein
MMRLLLMDLIILTVCALVSQAQNPNVNPNSIKNTQEDTSQQTQPGFEQADSEKKFEILFGSLKDKYNDYVADVMKTLAFLILCIGWFVTSDKSRDFFRRTVYIRFASIIALVVLAAIHCEACLSTLKSSHMAADNLRELSYIMPEYYESYIITPGRVIANLIQNTILFGVLVVILFFMKKPADAY